ncbi:MAG: peptidase dimerization domain-containing protein, partial [Gemmatimonadota bacterium]|nr:peptidase dimerization domain-containing protein [Gemmatimonadota bacterium]
GHRGRAELEVVLTGVAGHASAPQRARNALDLLAPVMSALADVSADQPDDPILGRSTMVPTMVEVLPETRNVIPDRVVIALDWRILPGDDDAGLLGRVRDAIAKRLPVVPEGLGVEVRMAEEHQVTWTGRAEDRNLLTPGFLMAPDHPVIRAAAAAVGKRGKEAEPASVRPWTFATDGGWTCGVHGIPSLGFAPGEERYAHTNTERLDVEEARWAFGRYPDLIVAMQNALR